MRKIVIAYSLLLAAMTVGSCSDQPLQEGEASWYGPGFDGQRTSSGEIYNPGDSTAAHRTLPFDTVVRVTNLENEKEVNVRINDRGPYAEGRIIDLSRSAAEALDMMDSGVAPVRLELVEAGGDIPEDLDQELYTIQVGEYSAPLYAERLADDIGEKARMEQVFLFGRTRYMVYFGYYDSISGAQKELEKLNKEGYEGLVKQIN